MDPTFYRKQAEIFAQVAERCAIPTLARYYRDLARRYLVQAERAERVAVRNNH